MLMITKVVQSDREYILQLDGSISGNGSSYYVSQPRLYWQKERGSHTRSENICFIDCEGLALIKSLMGQGVRQVNAPLFVADQLRKCEAAQGD